ncbi:response regulator transcription factor [Herbidospora mongoliensis]|uniref:response regulator transcription factor n=1 Tax=Herbidospora mongoliensis TaxID=688067 RepID=UPI00083333F5
MALLVFEGALLSVNAAAGYSVVIARKGAGVRIEMTNEGRFAEPVPGRGPANMRGAGRGRAGDLPGRADASGVRRAGGSAGVIRLVVADDDPLVRQALTVLLGAEPDMTDDGLTAVYQARLHCPAVILMDVRMPGHDGVEATRVISSWPEPRPGTG